MRRALTLTVTTVGEGAHAYEAASGERHWRCGAVPSGVALYTILLHA